MDSIPSLDEHIVQFRQELEIFKKAAGKAYAVSLEKLFDLSNMTFQIDMTGLTGRNDWRTTMNLIQDAIDHFRPDEEKTDVNVEILHRRIRNRYSNVFALLEDFRAKEQQRKRERELGGDDDDFIPSI